MVGICYVLGKGFVGSVSDYRVLTLTIIVEGFPLKIVLSLKVGRIVFVCFANGVSGVGEVAGRDGGCIIDS